MLTVGFHSERPIGRELVPKFFWRRLSEQFLDTQRLIASGLGRETIDLEASLGTLEYFLTDEDLDVFRAGSPETLHELSILLEDIHARHFVKMTVFTARFVPEALVPKLVLAGARTRNPSLNKHFIWPCVLLYGRRRVVSELLEIVQVGSEYEKAGALQALYWGAMARETICWPDGYGYSCEEPDESVDDLLDRLSRMVLPMFLEETDVSIRRRLLAYLPERTSENATLFAQVIEDARQSQDQYIQDALAYRLGTSNLIPCLPELEHPAERG